MGLPSGARYSVSSMVSLPSFMRTMRIRTPKRPSSFSYSAPYTSRSLIFSKCNTLLKNSVSRSISETVMPIVSTALMSCEKAGQVKTKNERLQTRTPRIKVLADTQRIGHDGERRVYRAAGYEKTSVDDVKIVQIVGFAVCIEHARSRIFAKTRRAHLVGDAGKGNLLADEQIARKKAFVAVVTM